ncbi:hypothetical protein AKJ41_04780 [candidate division MSBL1 archaeon SCGC-AAA259O05]|uniref:Uncharacterized protein n=1 Tax=candidate division MSBL1 archaeon SCGC-AAA259O05 TaxID=1698271 RepID=A0A133V085_9EURY|nr:hypothetical protein AKJ41_04780 [candidate division MSBL1 archaeon SCGC-AAA259O05]
MLDNLEKRQAYGLTIGVIVIAVIAFVAGSFLGGGLTDTFGGGNGATDEKIKIGEEVSKAEIKQNAQSFMDMQLTRSKQQLAMMVQRNENLSEGDVSIDANVTGVSSSEFDSLYRVNVEITGTVPSRTGGLRDIDQEQSLFISQDGRYVFQQPTDLENIQQQPPK